MNLPDIGARFVVAATLEPDATRGMLIRADFIAARRAGARGTFQGHVGGHGGDVWWIRHDDGVDAEVAPYAFNELTPEGGAA